VTEKSQERAAARAGGDASLIATIMLVVFALLFLAVLVAYTRHVDD
jgi:hypothetical protein